MFVGRFAVDRAICRDIYYNHKQLYVTQRLADRALTNICTLLGESRLALHVVCACARAHISEHTQMSSAKGAIHGDLVYTDGTGARVDCRSGATMITSHSHAATDVHSAARFILLVEKDATFLVC